MPALLTDDDRAQVLGLFTELKSKYAALDAAIAAGKPAGEIKTAIDKIQGDLVAFQEKQAATIKAAEARLDAVEEKQRQRPAMFEPPKSIGQQVVENEGFLAFAKSGSRGSHTVQLATTLWEKKDILSVSRGVPVAFDYVTTLPQVPIGVRALCPQGRTSAGAVAYVEETTFTNNAAPVAEGAAKPKSDKTFTPRTLPVETIAHYFKVSRQSYDDLPFLAAQIENNGIYGVKKAEDNQLLNGTGTSPQLKGIMPVATAAPAPTGTGVNLVDAIGAAVFDLAGKGYIADGVVVNPADWGHVAMIKNSQGNYVYANPADYSLLGRIWGVRMVQSANIAAGAFLAGAFQGNCQILDREQVSVQVATQNEDDFVKNLLTILVEERLVFLIYNATAFEKGIVPAGSLI